MTKPNQVRVSRLPAWQQQLLHQYFPRRKLISRTLYESVFRLHQYITEEEVPSTPDRHDKE